MWKGQPPAGKEQVQMKGMGMEPNSFKQQKPLFYISQRSTFPFSIVGGQR
jgi:hypothetical protein